MKSDFLIAVTQLAAERNLPREVVISAIEAALVSVYKKESENAGQNLSVKILPNSGEVKVCALKTVVEKVEDSDLEISLKDAAKYKKDAALGEVVEIETGAQFAGRIAAQTAKQVVMQRLKEAEREMIYEEFADREGDIVGAVVQRVEPRQIVLDIDKTEAVMPISETVPTERYRVGQRLKVLLLEVSKSPKGPQVIVSRSHRNLVSRLFELEVPEVYNGTVEIRAIAREAGYRTKVAVFAKQEGIDPVGSCVGLRGIRIQNIVNELHGEKIDVVQWGKEPTIFIANALSPAQVARVEIKQGQDSAVVVVPDRHLSLAIGKEGQNARLAAKLTGWRIDIKGAAEAEEERLRAVALAAQARPEPLAATKDETPTKEEPAVEAVAKALTEEPRTEVKKPVAPLEAAAAAKDLTIERAAPAYEETVEGPVAIEAALAEEEEAEPVQAEVVAAKAIEEIWPDEIEAVAMPSTELRFAEDLDIALPGRSRSKSKSKKRRGRRQVQAPGQEEAGAKPSKGKKSRTTVPSYDEYEADRD